MEARTFNGGTMPHVNERWTAKVLGIQRNSERGIDLVGDKYILEVKFSLPYEEGWTVIEYQMDYPLGYPNKNAYWGLGTYHLSTPVSEVRTHNPKELEKLVTFRELWVVSWGWMNQFPPSQTSGRTRLSEWSNVLRYPKKKLVPPTVKSHNVKKGRVYLTQGINLRDFNF